MWQVWSLGIDKAEISSNRWGQDGRSQQRDWLVRSRLRQDKPKGQVIVKCTEYRKVRFRLMVATAVCKVEHILVTEGEGEGESGRSLGNDSAKLMLQNARLMNENRPSNLACTNQRSTVYSVLCTPYCT